jgi:hypothetical protein
MRTVLISILAIIGTVAVIYSILKLVLLKFQPNCPICGSKAPRLYVDDPMLRAAALDRAMCPGCNTVWYYDLIEKRLFYSLENEMAPSPPSLVFL